MKKKLSALLVCLLSVVLAFALVACGGGTLTISDTSLSLTVGDTKQLTLKEGENDVTKDAKWESSDAKVVTVDSRGNVVAKAAGSATVTGTYNSASAKCEVTVTAKEVVTVTITDESGKEIKELTVDRDASVNVKATTSNGSKVTWAVSDSKYAIVEETADNAAKITGKLKTPDGAPVTVYATSGSARASLALTVTYTNAPAGYYDLTGPNDNGSIGQNKVEQGKWAYWADMTGWNGGSVDIQVAEYLGDKAGSEAGTVHFKYSASSFGNYPDSCVQLTYRNLYDETARPNGLKTAGYYKLTCKITSDAAGTINLNGTDIELKVGDNNVTVYFQHNDTTRVYEDDEYDNIYYTAIFLTAGQKLPAAELTLTDFKWEDFTPEALKAPTVAVANDKATVTDTVNTAANVDGYEIGFFAADAQTPKYTVKAIAGEETAINSASWDNGTYTVKVRALPASGMYQASPWSAATDVTYTVEHEALVYDLPFSASADITADGWYYWNELGAKTEEDAHGIVEAKYDDGTLTYEFSETKGNWYSQQLFFCNTSLSAGTYQITFTMTSSVAGEITVNNTVVTFTDDALTQQVKVNGAPGQMMISIQFGVNPSSAIQAGRFTITDIDIASGGTQPQPQPGTPTTPANPEDYQLGEKVNAQFTLQNENKDAFIGRDGAAEGKFAVWHTAENGWADCGTIVTMNETKIENNALTISYTGGSVGFSVQLYYNNPSVIEGKQYFLSMKINASELYTITINGVAYTLAAGENNVALVFTKGNSAAMQALDVQFPGYATQLTFVISDVAWQEVTGSTQPDTETLGEAINAKYTAVRKGAETKGDNDPDGADVSPNVWILWWREWDPVVTMNEGYKIENNVLTFSFSGGPAADNGEASWATQLFYNNTELTQGKTYRLFMKINSSAAYTINVNGTPVALVAGDNDVNVKFVLGNGISAVDIQFPSPEAHTIKISDVYWKEVNPTGGTQPETPAGDKEITVTPTEWYGNTFVKLSMSDADFALVKTAANCKVNGAEVQPHGEGKGFLVDGTVLQVQLPEAYAAGKTYTVVWYDAQGNAIAHATFTCQQA